VDGYVLYMARPYAHVGRLNSTPVDDELAPTTWDRIDGIVLPIAPDTPLPLALNRHLDYRLRHTDLGWVIEGRPSGRDSAADTE
jgi:hypothetical protein